MAKEQRDTKSLWIEGKKNWNELYGGSLSMAKFWRNLSMVVSLVCVILAGGVVWETLEFIFPVGGNTLVGFQCMEGFGADQKQVCGQTDAEILQKLH